MNPEPVPMPTKDLKPEPTAEPVQAQSDQVCEWAPMSVQEFKPEPLIIPELEPALSIFRDREPESEPAKSDQVCEPVLLVELDIMERSSTNPLSPEVCSFSCELSKYPAPNLLRRRAPRLLHRFQVSSSPIVCRSHSSTSACQPIGSTLAPRTLSSTVVCHPSGSLIPPPPPWLLPGSSLHQFCRGPSSRHCFDSLPGSSLHRLLPGSSLCQLPHGPHIYFIFKKLHFSVCPTPVCH